MPFGRPSRAGDTIEDYCRACKTDRHHTVIVTDGQGVPLRVSCDYCESQHNYRGGPRIDMPAAAAPAPDRSSTAGAPRATASSDAFPLVSDRERMAPPVTLPTDSSGNAIDLEQLLRRIIREEAGVTVVTPAAKWRGGTLIMRPGTPGLQDKEVPIETFFHKIVMLRNRLRTLEQQVNASELPEDVKLKLQSYVTGCYGSLTTFNVLFADADDDGFKGSSDA